MPKHASRLLVAVENVQVWRTLSRVGTNSHELVRASTETEIIDQLEQGSVAAVFVEPLVGGLSGLKALDLAREFQPDALRVVVSNFTDISLLIEGVHAGLVQRILGLPLIDTEVRAMLSGARAATASNLSRAARPFPPLRATVASAH